ncbi:4Fe-4S binding protein [Sphaerimonospora cavernae]|uniref:NADH-quinone oxidoreductase subunit I n=1 Tax=Sphaerimonospora cavernae TaxID=1740611 RepID=A0ABV6U8A6_9ACTN
MDNRAAGCGHVETWGCAFTSGRQCAMMLHVARIPGEGLAKGLAVTLRHMLRKSETQQYPEVHPDLPPRSRGVIALVEENCTVCMLCARECPDWCIYIDSHKETLPAPEGGRPRARNVLDRFAIDFSLCMYCGICVEVCPFDALFWSPEFEYAEYDIRDLIHEKDRLGEWAQTVPPPPSHEVGAEPPKEIAAASRPATRTPSRPGRTAPPGRTAEAEKAETAAGARTESAGEAATAVPSGTAEVSPGPSASARREPPRAMRDIRSIRPPGALPKAPKDPKPEPSRPAEPEPPRGSQGSQDSQEPSTRKKDGPKEES